MVRSAIQVNTSASYYADVARIQALDEVERMAASGRPFCVVECVSWTDKTPLSTVAAAAAPAPSRKKVKQAVAAE